MTIQDSLIVVYLNLSRILCYVYDDDKGYCAMRVGNNHECRKMEKGGE
jgi:hypothetical protein